MNKIAAVMSAVLAGVLISAPLVWAGDATPEVNARQKNQQDRIKQGVKSGELTKGDTAKMEKQQRHIKQEKKQAKADGKVTVAEQTKLQQDQDKASRQISRAKRNDKAARTQPDMRQQR